MTTPQRRHGHSACPLHCDTGLPPLLPAGYEHFVSTAQRQSQPESLRFSYHCPPDPLHYYCLFVLATSACLNTAIYARSAMAAEAVGDERRTARTRRKSGNSDGHVHWSEEFDGEASSELLGPLSTRSGACLCIHRGRIGPDAIGFVGTGRSRYLPAG